MWEPLGTPWPLGTWLITWDHAVTVGLWEPLGTHWPLGTCLITWNHEVTVGLWGLRESLASWDLVVLGILWDPALVHFASLWYQLCSKIMFVEPLAAAICTNFCTILQYFGVMFPGFG